MFTGKRSGMRAYKIYETMPKSGDYQGVMIQENASSRVDFLQLPTGNFLFKKSLSSES
jgi:hypothetical protein